MNLTAEKIKLEYMGVCSSLTNQYIQLSQTHPYESLERYRTMCRKFFWLVRIWEEIERQQKGLKHG